VIPTRERRPGGETGAAHHLDTTTTDQSAPSTSDNTAAPLPVVASETGTVSDAGQSDVDVPDWPPRRDWSGERAVIVDALALTVGPWAAREDVPEFGTAEWSGASPLARLVATLVHLLAVHDRCSRAEWAWTDRARQEEEARLTAQREASHAISAAIDWSAQSRRPSHAELERRRAEVVVPR